MKRNTQLAIGLGIVTIGVGGLLWWWFHPDDECKTNADCPSGYICERGKCVPDSGIPGNIEGIVTDCDTGSPISGVTVTIGASTSTTTDSSGQFSFVGVASGQHTVCFEHSTHRSKCDVVAVRAGQTASIEVCLNPGMPSDTGKILFSVKECSDTPYIPFPGITCHVDSASGVTDSDGHWRAEGLAPGVYYCTCDVPSGYTPHQSLPESVQVVAGVTSPMLIMLMPA